MELLQVNSLSDSELERHLSTFSKKLPIYADRFQISYAELEILHRHTVAFSWAVKMDIKLKTYSKETREIIKGMRLRSTRPLSVVNFIDLPRPPIFYVGSDLDNNFALLLKKIVEASGYTDEIGKELGIDVLLQDLPSY